VERIAGPEGGRPSAANPETGFERIRATIACLVPELLSRRVKAA